MLHYCLVILCYVTLHSFWTEKAEESKNIWCFICSKLSAGRRRVVTLRSCCFPAALIRRILHLLQSLYSLLLTRITLPVCFSVIDQHTNNGSVCFTVTVTHQCVLLTPVLVAVMRFWSCFGNQSPSHRDTRLSPHPGKFQHIFAKNSKMLVKIFENTLQSWFSFCLFWWPALTVFIKPKKISSSRSRLQFEVEQLNREGVPDAGIWTNHSPKSWFQKFYPFQELKEEIPEIRGVWDYGLIPSC